MLVPMFAALTMLIAVAMSHGSFAKRERSA
jgi:hypothetical protein